MYTRKQQWRHTKTRKIGKCSQETVEANLAAERGLMPRNVSWDHSDAVGMQQRAKKAAMSAQCAPNQDRVGKIPKEGPAVATAMATGHEAGCVSREPAVSLSREPAVNIPRSRSDSSLVPRRTLFPRSSSKHDLGPAPSRLRDAVRRPHQKSVSFNTQVKIVLIPKREEYSGEDKALLWWGKDDYARFRQVLINWKRVNMHRMSQSDNILSINLADVDDEDLREHEATVAAADAIAAAAAQAAAQAAAAAAAATAAEVARAEEEDRAARERALAYKKRAEEKEEAKATAGRADARYMQPRGPLADVSEERALVEGGAKPRAQGSHRARASFSNGAGGKFGSSSSGGGGWGGIEAYRVNDDAGARTTMPLRRAHTFVKSPPSPPLDSPLKAVPLSDRQATAESLREWQKSFNERAVGLVTGGDDSEESRERALSLQQQNRSYARRGRATPKLTGGVGPEVAHDSSESEDSSSGQEEEAEGLSEEEKQQRTLSDQSASPSSAAFANRANPVLIAFERQQREAAVLQAEIEEKERARAAATVEAAKAEAAKGAEAATSGGAKVTGAERAGGGESVVQLGLNDAPGSAAAAAAVGVHVATDGISNLALRARDSVENLQDLPEQPWVPEPLSSSA